MPITIRKFDVNQAIWFLDASTNNVYPGTIMSIDMHVFYTPDFTEKTVVLYKIFSEAASNYFLVAEQHIGADEIEANTILANAIDTHLC